MDSVPKLDPGNSRTVVARTAVVGGRFVSLSIGVAAVEGLPQVDHTAAGARAYGVSAQDAAPTARITAFKGNQVARVEAGAALAHGQPVQSDATGRAIPLAAGVQTGWCEADTAVGAHAPIALTL